MLSKTSSERMTEAMERTLRHLQTPRKSKSASPGFTIAISRQAGARGREVALALGEQLHWPVYDKELLQHIAGEKGLRLDLLESVDEKCKGWLQELVEGFSSQPAVSEFAFTRHLVEALLSLAAHGECVILGRGAAQVLPAPTTLRVRLVASLKDRIEVTRARTGCTPAEAESWIEQTDQERTRFVQDHFRKDPDAPQQYDLVINSSRYSVEECVRLIIEALCPLQAGRQAAKVVPAR